MAEVVALPLRLNLWCASLRLGNAAERRVRIDGFSVPEFSVSRPPHYLKVQMRKILRRVARGSNEAECIPSRDHATDVHALVVALHVCVVVDEPDLRVDGVHRDAAETARRHPKDLAVVGR